MNTTTYFRTDRIDEHHGTFGWQRCDNPPCSIIYVDADTGRTVGCNHTAPDGMARPFGKGRPAPIITERTLADPITESLARQDAHYRTHDRNVEATS